MKIVNEKGKLFGIINVVDLVVLLFIILVAAAAIYKFAAPAASEVIAPKSDMYVTMRIRGTFDYLDAEIADKLKPGDKLIAGSDYIPGAEVVSVKKIPYLSAGETSEGKFVTSEDPQKSDTIIVVKAKQAKNDPILKIGNQEVRIARGFIFKTQLFEMNAIIESVEFDG